MTIEALKERIREIVCEYGQLQPDEVGDEAKLHTDLGIDSLSLLEIALRVDQEFGADFKEEELLKMSSVNAAATLVAERLAVEA